MNKRKRSITTHQLAALCGVSQGTVDRALNNRGGIKEETKKKVLAAARQYGYRPNVHASVLAQGKSKLIGIVVFDLKNEYFSEIVMAVQGECGKRGYSILLMFSMQDKNSEISCFEELYAMGVDGIVCCPVNEGAVLRAFCKTKKIPVVTVGNRAEGLAYVGIDDFSAMKEITEYAGSKSRRLIYYGPPLAYHGLNLSAQLLRRDGFRAAQTAARKEIVPYPCVFDFLEEDAAVVCASDYFALQLHLKHPHWKLTGFDNIYSLERYGLKLTTVGISYKALAERVVEFFENKEEDKTVYIPHRIIENGGGSL